MQRELYLKLIIISRVTYKILQLQEERRAEMELMVTENNNLSHQNELLKVELQEELRLSATLSLKLSQYEKSKYQIETILEIQW
jgi:hypothetical protein